MSQNTSVSTIVFDVNETLLDITALEPLFERLFGNRSAMREWFAQLILYSEAMTLSGLYTPFGELAVGTLRMVASTYAVAIAAGDIEELKTRLATMPAHPDSAPALTVLQNAGFRLVTLTNSASTSSPTPLEHAGLSEFFERSFSVEEVRKFKPAPDTYHHVANELNVEASKLCLVACHLWDTIGAQAAGLYGALITRTGNAILPASGVPVPDLVALDLSTLADQIVRRWRLSVP